jgi:PEP-CTERM motif-containing protein
MQTKRRWRAVTCALGLAATVASARVASALTLADLDGGAGFTIGSLTFSDFDATATGDISLDLADYPVQLLADGFRLSGPLSVLLGDTGTLLLSYTVSAADPILTGASLFAAGVAIDPGAQAWVGESLLGPGNAVLGSLFVYAIDGVGTSPGDAASFAPVAQIAVAKTVNLASGTFAAIPVIDQRFVFVPEPIAMWLLTLGLVGLAWWRPRKVLAG